MSKTGHERLIADLRSVVAEAEAFEFHDFKNTKYATPKIALAEVLHRLRRNVIDGAYDNAPEDEHAGHTTDGSADRPRG